MNVERIYENNYQNLFTVDIFHDYFLKKYYFDQGGLLQEDLDAQSVLQQRYEVSDFFEIQPTARCKTLLKNFKVVFRKTPRGVMTLIWQDGTSRPQIPLDDNMNFEFMILLKDMNFFNYTDLPLDGLPYIFDVDDFYRTIYYFNNFNGTATYPYLTRNQTTVSISDRLSARTYDLDSPLTIGLISIKPKNMSNPDFDLLNSDDTLKSPAFQIHFKARWMRWIYLNQDNSQYDSTEALPLSKAGINPVLLNDNGIEYQPSADVKMINYPASININTPDSNLMYSRIFL